MKVSVCMATYNGASYLGEQLASVLAQLQDSDELVIVDDASGDDTIDIILGLADSRVRLIRNETNSGAIKSFETGLMAVTGDIIFLCDQDDLWRPDKVSRICSAFRSSLDVTLVLSDVEVINGEGELVSSSWLRSRKFAAGILPNLLKNRYLGCSMAFRRSLLEYCLPFPADIPMHDMWIGTVNQLFGRAVLIPEPLMRYRRHRNNTTSLRHANLSKMLIWRYALAKDLLMRRFQAKKRRVL